MSYAISKKAARLPAVLVFSLFAVLWPLASNAEGPRVTVYKTPTCNCCGKWIDHLKENGFEVTWKDQAELSRIKAMAGVRPELASCHTAIVGGYVVEGHVPADVIRRLLEERPPVLGVTVPGMPVGSPGMEVGPKQPYDVLTFDEEGRTEVYAKER